jgi:hypothetical protein
VSRRRWVRILAAVVAAPAGLLALSLVGVFPWSRVNCWTREIDINSGRTRATRSLLWVTTVGPPEDTDLTRALAPGDLAGRPADWKKVTTLSPLQNYSPHHYYHGAGSQAFLLTEAWEAGRATPAARRESARRVLRLWQESGNDGRAGDYVLAILDRAGVARDAGRTLDVADLPAP